MRPFFMPLLLVLCMTLIGCGPSQAEMDAQATSIASDIFATQTAEMPTATQTPVPPTPTLTLQATPTYTDIPTSTAMPSPTIRPTFTSVPQPAWITEFAEPILAAIAGRAPDYQDDFSSNKGKWTRGGECTNAEWRLKFVDGEMVASSCSFSRDMWYTDFVINMDARLLSRGPRDEWRFSFRFNNFFDFEQNLGVEVGFGEYSPGKYVRVDNVLKPGPKVNHVLIIVKDQGVALFVNDRPVYYGILESRWKNGGMDWSGPGTIAYDNFKIWDISDIPLATLPAP